MEIMEEDARGNGYARARSVERSIMPELGRLWFLHPRLCDRRWEEGPTKVTRAVARVMAGGAEETESCN